MPTITLYDLSRGADGFVRWVGPDRTAHFIDVQNPPNPPNSWAITNDASGRPVIAYQQGANGSDGTLCVSLDGAPSIIATLLHNEDDTPRKYYFATDGHNNNPLGRKAFVLRCEGVNGSPVQNYANFRVMVVVP